MPLGDPGFYGTNADDTRNEDYCIYCYAGGGFTEDVTMDEMIVQCAEMALEYGSSGESLEGITARMKGAFPKLKRWNR